MNLSAFQACDIRGIFGPDAAAAISPAIAFRVGRSLARRAPAGRPIVLAGDGRASTAVLLDALRKGIGREVVDLGVGVPTPLAYVARTLAGAGASAFVTASHNPPAFNGIKLQIGDLPITPEELGAIRDEVAGMADAGPAAADARPAPADPLLASAWAAHHDAAAEAFGSAAGAAVAADCMHGCYAGRARGGLEALGFRVTALRDERAGDFRGIVPNPAVDANIASLVARVSAGGFQFGVAFDGDGDRARFVDERGCPVDNGTALAILVRFIVESGRAGGRRRVVYDQKMRLAVVSALREAGCEPVLEKSGHTFIRTRMIRERALFGGENSGHFFWGAEGVYPVPAGDCGLFAAIAMGAALRHFGRTLSALAATVPASPFYTDDIRGLRFRGDRAALLQGVAQSVGRSGCSVSTLDGVRIERPGAFAHVRASVTESDMLTAAFDANTWNELRDMAELVIEALGPEAGEVASRIREGVERRRAPNTARPESSQGRESA